MKDERECVICGTHYSYCPNCADYSSEPRWKFLFHDQNCHDIYNVLNNYGAGIITKDEARTKLQGLNLSKKNSFRKDFREQIDDIMARPVQKQQYNYKKK